MDTAHREKDPRTHALIGCGFEVHTAVAGSFGENVCRDAFAVVLQLRGVPFRTEVPFPILCQQHRLPSFYRADFVCFDTVIVEIKSIGVRTGPIEHAQMLRYLGASGLRCGCC